MSASWPRRTSSGGPSTRASTTRRLSTAGAGFSEGSIWNLAFWDGTSVVWPVAEMLGGVTMGVVRRQLDRLGVPQRVQEITLADLPGLTGAVVMNSWTPGVAVHRIASVHLPEAPSFVELLHRAYRAEPLTSL